MPGKFPDNAIQVSGIEKINGNIFDLKDGSQVKADALIFCTGYLYDFSFLDSSCGINLDDDYVYPLYKQMVNANHPTMFLICVHSWVLFLPLSYIQVCKTYNLVIIKIIIKIKIYEEKYFGYTEYYYIKNLSLA